MKLLGIIASPLRTDTKVASKTIELPFSRLFNNRIVKCQCQGDKLKLCKLFEEKMEDDYNAKVKIFPAEKGPYGKIVGVTEKMDKIMMLDALVGCVEEGGGKRRFVVLNKRTLKTMFV